MPLTAARSRIIVLLLLCFLSCAAILAQAQRTNPDLTAHEWGTFTSIAGFDGKAAKWSTLNGSAELPSFVEHIAGIYFKAGLRGTVRMETPVLYLYSPEQTEVSVKVAFSKGIITEWYPHASRVTPDGTHFPGSDLFTHKHAKGTIAWDSVVVSPTAAANFPLDPKSPNDRENQYYAARETSAPPLLVSTGAGTQQERFLFYRGVSSISIPISATITSAGEVRLANLGDEEIPSVILFERRGDKVGYRIGGALSGQMSLDAPQLTATVETLSRDLQEVLTSQGLNPDEARAMIATWNGSWFEEGSRVFYIVPQSYLATNLPLTINPSPEKIVRVFVGRLELVTPATEEAVQKILAAHDAVGLEKYLRFLEPILAKMKADNPAQADQINADMDQIYNSGTLRSYPPYNNQR
jgi:hypothetical protein